MAERLEAVMARAAGRAGWVAEKAGVGEAAAARAAEAEEMVT
jgi:hypothetical protein